MQIIYITCIYCTLFHLLCLGTLEWSRRMRQVYANNLATVITRLNPMNWAGLEPRLSGAKRGLDITRLTGLHKYYLSSFRITSYKSMAMHTLPTCRQIDWIPTSITYLPSALTEDSTIQNCAPISTHHNVDMLHTTTQSIRAPSYIDYNIDFIFTSIWSLLAS